MGEAVQLNRPIACSEDQRRQFARLVRLGFGGSDAGLPRRIRAASLLALYYARDGTLTAIAAIKAPGEQYRRDVFERASAGVDSAAYRLELGWVFVAPEHRGKRLAGDLCRRLIGSMPEAPVFAPTRPDNRPMIAILLGLGFGRAGRPYLHRRRAEELALFLRPAPPE